MQKMYINEDVYTAFCKRMDCIFSEFDNIYVSFSGGKDSGTLLQLVFKYMEDNGINKRIGIFHQDFEAQYKKTTEFVERIFQSHEDRADLYWSCIPMQVRTALSNYEMYWYTWDPDKKDAWVRKMPDHPYVYTLENNDFDFYEYKMMEESFYKRFSKYYHQKHGGGKTCALVGIRCDESLHRYSAIVNKRYGYNNTPWITKQYKDIYSAAPIYDWRVEDVWTAVGKFGFDYNRLYDLYYKAGLTLDQMRVASPFLDQAKESLELYRRIEPETWIKLLGRVRGANFGAIYAKTKAMGYKNITLPEGMTWKEYTFFLLDTLPENVRNQYLKKFRFSEEFWKTKGGGLSAETIKEMKEKGYAVHTNGLSSYTLTEKQKVVFDQEIPDNMDDVKSAMPLELPSWKRCCYCILKNDHMCKNMGFGPVKEEQARINALKDKYKSIIKGGKKDV